MVVKPNYPNTQEELRNIEEAMKIIKNCQDRLETKLAKRNLKIQDDMIYP